MGAAAAILQSFADDALAQKEVAPELQLARHDGGMGFLTRS